METDQLEHHGGDGRSAADVDSCPLPAVLQVSEHQGGPDWTGGVDGAGPVHCHQRCQRHALGLPAVEEGSEGSQEARQRAAADVSTLGMVGQGTRSPYCSLIWLGSLITILFFLVSSGKTFRGTTIGMAPLEGMCSADNSGGVSVVREA